MEKDSSVWSYEELYSFADFLRNSRLEQDDLINRIKQAEQLVCANWEDRKNREFTEEFNSYLDNLRKLCQLLERHEAFVRECARKIEEYNEIRGNA